MRLFAMIALVLYLAVPAAALEIEPPLVPGESALRMPEETEDLQTGLGQLLHKAVSGLGSDVREAGRVCLGLTAAVLLVSLPGAFSGVPAPVLNSAGTLAAGVLLLQNTRSMVGLAAETVMGIGDYGKLLLPVMTAGLAAQGSVSASAALYAGTALFSSVLQSLISKVLMPGIYLYLALSLGAGATGEALLKKTADLLKSCLSWGLKLLVMIFTTYLSLTGVVSGATDAAALKAAKVTMSTVVPVVGGALSDASEAVLVSASLMKNSAGIYGILAVLALFLHPFLRLSIHYWLLRLTGALGAIFGSGGITGVLDAFAAALGLLLGMTACSCVMVLISTICFLKGGL